MKGFKTRFHLYTVPGQAYYNASRKLILKSVDGVIFVADSQGERMEANIEAMHNLYENLESYGYDLTNIPFAMQYKQAGSAQRHVDGRSQIAAQSHGSARFRGRSDQGPRGIRDAGRGQQDGRSGSQLRRPWKGVVTFPMRSRSGES